MVKASKIVAEAAKTPLRVGSSVVSRFTPKNGPPPLFLFGFNIWKTFMHDWFPDRRVIFAPMNMWPIEFDIDWKWRILSDPRSEVLSWQYKGPPQLKRFCNKRGIPFRYVEDGFIRSISIGAHHVPPMSLAFDKQDMYFNASAPTDLETILLTYDFASDEVLMTRARKVMERLLDSGLSKYNSGDIADIETIYGEKTRKRVLVIGQVERDASITYGSEKRYSNNDLVWLARRENPDAHIIYKPHPEVLLGTAEAMSDPNAVRGVATVIDQNISLSDSFKTIDHVYTITSLSGFEALMRGIKVTTFGCPFYAGWGITDDRQPNARRTRTLSVEEIFAASYILYPRYFDPIAKEYIEIEEALDILYDMRNGMLPQGKVQAPPPDPVKELAMALALEMKKVKS